MLKRALLKCDCIIKQPALKTLSTKAKESRNIQGTAVNNVEKLLKNIIKIVFKTQKCSSSSFEGHPLQVRHKQDLGRGFILLLPQAAELPEADADSDVVKPTSSFVIQNRQTSCSMWCPMYRARC